jgi:hypothetical protein
MLPIEFKGVEDVAIVVRGDLLTVSCRTCGGTATQTLTPGVSTPPVPHVSGCTVAWPVAWSLN